MLSLEYRERCHSQTAAIAQRYMKYLDVERERGSDKNRKVQTVRGEK